MDTTGMNRLAVLQWSDLSAMDTIRSCRFNGAMTFQPWIPMIRALTAGVLHASMEP